jgi:hypothetical protein
MIIRIYARRQDDIIVIVLILTSLGKLSSWLRSKDFKVYNVLTCAVIWAIW